MIYTSVKSAFFTYSFVLNSVADVTSLKKIESTETWLEWKTDVQNSTVQWLCRKVDYREVATSFLVSLCTFILIRPPGTGRPYVLLLFIIFFFKVRSPRSVGRSPQILPHGHKHVQFTNAGTKIWWPAPPKILCTKNMLILARFQTLSHFWA